MTQNVQLNTFTYKMPISVRLPRVRRDHTSQLIMVKEPTASSSHVQVRQEADKERAGNNENAINVQASQIGQLAQARWNAASQLIVVKPPASPSSHVQVRQEAEEEEEEEEEEGVGRDERYQLTAPADWSAGPSWWDAAGQTVVVTVPTSSSSHVQVRHKTMKRVFPVMKIPSRTGTADWSAGPS